MVLESMHALRRQVFHDELKWSAGLNVIRNMEFDEYDRPDTWYIVHTDQRGEVDATCRLIPTSRPYMLADHYPEFVEKIPLPQSDDVWEISRFCASVPAKTASRGRIAGQLIAAAIEFGLKNGIKNYIALATDEIIPVIKRINGWDPQPLGTRKATPDDFSYSVLYTVSPDMLDAVRKKNGITQPLLDDIQTTEAQMPRQINLTAISQQRQTHFDTKETDHHAEMERTLSYLEAMAFARDYQSIMEGLRFTRLILQCDKVPANEAKKFKADALQALDVAYRTLKDQLRYYDDAAK